MPRLKKHEELWRRENLRVAKKNPLAAKLCERLSFIMPLTFVVGLGQAAPDDLVDLVKLGQYHDPNRVRLKLMRPCQCHANSAELYLADPVGTTIVTGYGLGPKDRLWREHTWVVRDGRIIETTVKRNAYFGYALTTWHSEVFADGNQ